ncbi:hypothetical protein I35_7566 [Burkholderia cenocepacia H111]|nr:hypothetical protein I35_7566 [Burkholderia cenocepacia H111]
MPNERSRRFYAYVRGGSVARPCEIFANDAEPRMKTRHPGRTRYLLQNARCAKTAPVESSCRYSRQNHTSPMVALGSARLGSLAIFQ